MLNAVLMFFSPIGLGLDQYRRHDPKVRLIYCIPYSKHFMLTRYACKFLERGVWGKRDTTPIDVKHSP